MINELYEQLKTACNNEERGKITPNEYNIALPLILTKAYNELFVDYRSLINKKNKYNLGATIAKDSFVSEQLLEYYLVANHSLTITNRRAMLPNDLFYTESMVNENAAEYDKLPLNKFNLLLGSRYKSSTCYPSYTQYGNQIEIYPHGLVFLNYYRKQKTPKWTFSTIAGKELFNPLASDFQDIDMHPSQKDKIFNDLLIFFGLNRKDQQIQQTGMVLGGDSNQKSKSL